MRASHPEFRISRRQALSGLAAVAAYGTAGCNSSVAQSDLAGAVTESGAGPVFDPGGPDAQLYGRAEGYPVPDVLTALREGNPWEHRYRVGAFSHLDAIFSTRKLDRATTPWAFKREPAELHYSFEGRRSSLPDYLSRNPVTGLLVAKDDTILFEHYQYARTDRDRLVSQSMVKSIMGLLVGLAVAEGAIKSVDDTAETYVPGLRGSEYGKTPIRDLLHMSSGVDFGENRDGGRDLNRLWADMVVGVGNKGTLSSLTQFNHRIAPPGTRFSYASIEPDVLGQVVHYAVGRPLSDYLRERVWQPIGAEAEATWLVDAEGFELPHFGFSAVLRDYARLGRLLAWDGAWEGQQIIPAQWVRDATTVRPSDTYLAPGAAMPTFGYGYLLWLLPGDRRQFAFVGAFGQRICIDPASKLVMVQTALDDKDGEVWHLWSALARQLSEGG
jgi:CubicO group peptidase (beta-lactamase class C family)